MAKHQLTLAPSSYSREEPNGFWRDFHYIHGHIAKHRPTASPFPRLCGHYLLSPMIKDGVLFMSASSEILRTTRIYIGGYDINNHLPKIGFFLSVVEINSIHRKHLRPPHVDFLYCHPKKKGFYPPWSSAHP